MGHTTTSLAATVLAVTCLAATAGCSGSVDADTKPAPSAESGTSSAPAPVTEQRGSVLVFQATEGLSTVPVAGGPITVVVPGSDLEHPDWSPDGTQLAYDRDFTAIEVAEVERGEGTAVFTCVAPCSSVQDPAWAPDGNEVAFTSLRAKDATSTAGSALVAVDVASGARRTLIDDRTGIVGFYSPRWSPDGRRLVAERSTYSSDRLDETTITRTQIVVVGPQPTDVRVVASWAGPAGGPSGAQPDWGAGEQIVYTHDGNLHVMRPDGSRDRRITSYDDVGEHAIQPTITADGTQVVFTHVTGTYYAGERAEAASIPIDGGTVTVLADGIPITHPRPND